MPKDEFDFEDPFELNGMAMVTTEDTTKDMAECFIEEFMRLGHNHKQVLALFRNSFYIGPNMVLEKRGEPFIRELITEVFARWGKPAKWASCEETNLLSSTNNVEEREQARERAVELSPIPATQEGQGEGFRTDPAGAPIPDITL
jgi:hypothetical protein